MSRQEIANKLAGIALVYRFGNPSHQPWSEHEKRTLAKAQEMEAPGVSFNLPGKAELFFKKCGLSVKENVCPEDIEKRIFERVVELLAERSQKRLLRSSGEQQFFKPRGVENRELYLVSTASCHRMKNQRGEPFADETGGTKIAWAVEGNIIRERVSNTPISSSLLAHASGGICMPDVTGNRLHSQNLDNPANQPFLDLLEHVLLHFSDYLSHDNDDDRRMFGYEDQKYMLMCLQIVVAENGAGMGRRGPHQDQWATTGAAIVGVSLLNRRAITMSHCTQARTKATFPLPRRSAYVLSGAVRYGSLWTDLMCEFRHGLESFGSCRQESNNRGKAMSFPEKVRKERSHHLLHKHVSYHCF